MSKPVLAVFGALGQNYMPLLSEHLPEWDIQNWLVDKDDTKTRDKLCAICTGAIVSPDFVLGEGNFGALLQGKNLKVILQPWVGVDWLDPDALPEGLIYCNAGGHAPPMAEFIIGAMLEHSLKLRRAHNDMLSGSWYMGGRNVLADSRHGDLQGKTLGIVGYGEIAQATAMRAAAFDMQIIAIARSPRDTPPAPLHWIGVQADLPHLLAQSDYIALTCDLNDETRNMFDKAAFVQMKDSAYLINVARGEVCHAQDFYEALRDKVIAGAAIDTWYRYPFDNVHAEPDPDTGKAFCGAQFDFLSLDNVLLTPHYAAHTWGAEKGRYESIAISLQQYSASQPIKRQVATGTGKNFGAPAFDPKNSG